MHGEEVAEYYTTTETLSSPDTKLDYFVGDISTARCYAFWVQKDYNNVDISYFQYSPYDLGKTVLGTEFGRENSLIRRRYANPAWRCDRQRAGWDRPASGNHGD